MDFHCCKTKFTVGILGDMRQGQALSCVDLCTCTAKDARLYFSGLRLFFYGIRFTFLASACAFCFFLASVRSFLASFSFFSGLARAIRLCFPVFPVLTRHVHTWTQSHGLWKTGTEFQITSDSKWRGRWREVQTRSTVVCSLYLKVCNIAFHLSSQQKII